ncbi:GNAT family N-acetyltransferase [Brevibacillus choshinensis]|uniref:GNAT family N-acetyltransferase n=1 Tax=Brevibacillus choshinensis TaxID=54911 RepID=A0ABX7FMI8_BRECH|nr:GNAT family N-acetyltransferase [Brevibacillus choshinensis]QRG67458.1 GNAT family N-acetyltransferase [Brevibacillus choshinensis]
MITIKRMSDCTFAEVTKAWNRGFEGYFFPVAMTEEMLVQRLGAEGYVLGLSVVAFDDQEPIGLVASGLRTVNGKKIAWNGGTGVATAYRRQGVGRQLMAATLELYEEAGVDDATLEAVSQNDKAIALYEQLGYEVLDRLLFWQRTDALPENLFGVKENAPYRVRHVLAQEVSRLPFYQADAPWQNQWQSMRDGEALSIEDEQGQTVGYAMYKRMVNDEGKVSAIVLRHCAAQPGHADADTIMRAALHELYAPHDLECRRSTFNLPAAQEQLLHILEEAGFGPSGTEQVYMVKKMKKPEDAAV